MKEYKKYEYVMRECNKDFYYISYALQGRKKDVIDTLKSFLSLVENKEIECEPKQRLAFRYFLSILERK